MSGIARLREFVGSFASVLASATGEPEILAEGGRLLAALVAKDDWLPEERLEPGAVAVVSPRVGDIHRVANAYEDRGSISIHVYGANIGAVERATYDSTGNAKRFISGYANRALPNLWDRSPSA